MTPPARRSPSDRLAGAVTSFVFVVMLAGQFSLDRLGIANPLPIPERVGALIIALIFFALPMVSVARRHLLSDRIPVQRTVLLLFALLLASAVWAPPSPGLLGSIWDIVSLMSCLLLLGFALRLSRDSVVSVFLAAILIAATVYSVAGLLPGQTGSRISAFGGGPNVYARVTGMGILAGLYFLMSDRGRGWRYAVALTPMMAVATILSGSRGAMLGTVTAILVLALTLRVRTWGRIVLWLGAVSPIIFVFYTKFGGPVVRVVDERIYRLTLQERYSSGRGPLLAWARDMFLERPFSGWGLHGFEAIHGSSSGFPYPHNFILQLAAEVGILGLVVFGAICLQTLLVLGRIPWRSPSVSVPLSCAVLVATASQFSGDYYDSRFAWAFLLISLSWHPPGNAQDPVLAEHRTREPAPAGSTHAHRPAFRPIRESRPLP